MISVWIDKKGNEEKKSLVRHIWAQKLETVFFSNIGVLAEMNAH